MIALRPMTEFEFEQYRSAALGEYARERARNFGTPLEQERAVAERQYAELLKDGVHTKGHRLWTVMQDTGEAVGSLWVYVDEDQKRAFIYYIVISPEHRGKGYGKRTLEVLEEELKSMGVNWIGLNVFADNSVAIGLYQKQGYRTTNFNMQQRL